MAMAAIVLAIVGRLVMNRNGNSASSNTETLARIESKLKSMCDTLNLITTRLEILLDRERR